MPLTSINEPGNVDAFGVRFAMEDRGERVRCHVVKRAIDKLEERSSNSKDELLARFEKRREMFERLASDLYDAGHRTPWIGAFMLPN